MSDIESAQSRAVPTQWRGIMLEPWTLRRAAAAQVAGMRYPNLSAADVASWNERASYPALWQDVVLHVWLRSLSESAVREQMGNPSRMLDSALDFADVHGIGPTSDAYVDARGLFFQTVADEQSATTKPEVRGSVGELLG